MLYINISGHDYRYEVEDIVKVFFNDGEIVYVDNQPPEGFRGIFMSSVLEMGTGRLAIRLVSADGLSFERAVGLADVKGDSPEALQRQIKKKLKRQIYDALREITGKASPWGILTGIRPTKLVHELAADGLEKNELIIKLRDSYRVSDMKAKLLYEVAAAESPIVQSAASSSVSVYIGIPFCKTRCLYCSFTSNPIDKYSSMVEAYLAALKKEICSMGNMVKSKGYSIQSIYIGGGTPTSISPEQLAGLLCHIESQFNMDAVEEYTLEAGRPDTIDSDMLEAIKDSRVTRISINPQTMNNVTLEAIGRNHSEADVVRAFEAARRMNFKNINTDIIAGLPGENLGMFEGTVRKICGLAPESITVHTMAIKRASRLKEERVKYELPSGQVTASMVELAGDYTRNSGMHPYYLYRQKNILGNLENVGYCIPGFESIYNVQIMAEVQTILALGAGGVTKLVFPGDNRIERVFNVKNVEEYIKRIDEMIERKNSAFL